MMPRQKKKDIAARPAIGSHSYNPTVGMSGPLLLYPDETVQHAGMFFLGYKGCR